MQAFLCYTGASVQEHFVMAEKTPQTLANHTKLDPLYHFVVLPVFAFAAIGGTIHFLWRPSFHTGSFFVISVAAAIAVAKIRTYTLKVQDRVIRLEERLRLNSLCSEPLRSRLEELTEGQLIALRFASDGEAPRLAERAIAEKLSRADIKKAIQAWRPDYWRI
jgi:hypothetical protein